jgi:hypothetical protein
VVKFLLKMTMSWRANKKKSEFTFDTGAGGPQDTTFTTLRFAGFTAVSRGLFSLNHSDNEWS